MQSSEHPIQTVFWRELVTAKIEKNYIPDRERQKIVFDRINWDTFRDELIADGVNGKQVRGKLFEMLIQADPTFGQRSALEKELLDLAHNPDKYGLGKELGYHRNPDMAFLIVEHADGVVIEGVGESKLGLLNERSFKQLSESGFARGVQALVEVVNALPDPEAHGLIEVARTRSKLENQTELLKIAPEFSQLLVVPANRNIEWKSTLVNRRELSAEGREQFYALLEDTRHVRTARAAFSTAEVGAMVEMLIPRL